MIFVYLFAAVIGLIVYLLGFRLNTGHRIVLAFLVFAALATTITVWVVVVGDRAPSDAVTVPLVAPVGE